MIVRSSEPRKFFAENEQNRPYANFNQVGYECKEHCERNDCEVSREARPGTAELILMANEFKSRKYRHAVDKNRTNHGNGTDKHWNQNRNSGNGLHPSVAKKAILVAIYCPFAGAERFSRTICAAFFAKS